MTANQQSLAGNRPARPFDITEFFKDAKVSEFICGRSMLAVLAAPIMRPRIQPEDDILLLDGEISESDDPQSSEQEAIELPKSE